MGQRNTVFELNADISCESVVISRLSGHFGHYNDGWSCTGQVAIYLSYIQVKYR